MKLVLHFRHRKVVATAKRDNLYIEIYKLIWEKRGNSTYHMHAIASTVKGTPSGMRSWFEYFYSSPVSIFVMETTSVFDTLYIEGKHDNFQFDVNSYKFSMMY